MQMMAPRFDDWLETPDGKKAYERITNLPTYRAAADMSMRDAFLAGVAFSRDRSAAAAVDREVDADRAYLNGLNAGFNLGVNGDTARYNQARLCREGELRQVKPSHLLDHGGTCIRCKGNVRDSIGRDCPGEKRRTT